MPPVPAGSAYYDCSSPSQAALLANLLGAASYWAPARVPDLVFANGSRCECSWLAGPLPPSAQMATAGKAAKATAGFPAPVTMHYLTTGTAGSSVVAGTF